MQCWVCMFNGYTMMGNTIIDGQCLCGRHAFMYDTYMTNESYLSNPASTHSAAFKYWMKATSQS